MNDSTTESNSILLPSLNEVEMIIGYTFKNKELLNEAFTHNSYKDHLDPQTSNERLEYLGDSVLNLMFAKQHYFSYPKMKSGELTQLRAANVDTEALARVGFKHGLHRFLKHDDPSLNERVEEFKEGIKQYPLHSQGMINSPKILADIVEAVIGAVYVDTGLSIDDTWEVVKNLLEPLTTPENLSLNPVKKLNETCQKMGIKLEYKSLWIETGDIEVYKDNKLIGKGNYKKKKTTAKNKAAADAYENLIKLFDI
ncbi:ribonuclease 3-like protein 3 [Bidens hawaiensis]|uniref:ribonuclease 3-like protein 3 n=1 Tax=Bidens hawaiensis TaxID=980011 RepID=UPI00404A8D66